MKKYLQWSLLALTTALIPGCVLYQRVVWSPDGSIAAVMAGDVERGGGLRLCSPAGELTPLLLDGVYAAQWFPDGKELLVCRATKVTNWDQIVRILPEHGQRQLIELADQISPLLAESAEWQAIDQLIPETMPVAETRKAAYFVLRDLRAEPNVKKLAEKYGYGDETSLFVHRLQRITVNGMSAQVGGVVAWSLDHFISARISPTRAAVAYTAGIRQGTDSRPTLPELFVANLDGRSAPIHVTSYASFFPDWTFDGRFLVYVAPADEFSDAFGAVYRQQVEGASLMGERQALAYVFRPNSDASVRVRCMPDGRIVFATIPLTLPLTEADAPQRQQLFAIDPEKQATLTRVTPLGAEHDLPQELGYFEMSPNFKKIAFIGEKGRVTLFEIATGKTTVVSTSDVKKLRSLPAWRNHEELTLVVSHVGETDDDPERDEIVIWSEAGGFRLLSRDWSEDSVSGFLK